MSGIVANAISHLKDIEESMRLEGKSFTQEDIENCDKIADLLQELEKEVKKLHDEFETETIKSSVFRHKLSFFHFDLNKEIEENVRAARESNKDVIQSLKNKLDSLSKGMKELHEKDKVLSQEIQVMRPLKKSLGKNHQEIIDSLNKNMSSKAGAQIVLNETKDVLRETKKAIEILEEEMMNLKESLIKEKAEAREEKLKLEEERRNTNIKAISQEEFNQTKGREVEAVQKSLEQITKALRLVFRENERLEQQIIEIQKQIEKSSRDLQEEKDNNEALRAENTRLLKLEVQNEIDYKKTRADTIQNTKDAIEKTRVEAENLKNFKDYQENKKEELKDTYERFKEIQIFIEGSKKVQDDIRNEIAIKLQEMADLELKNQQIYKELSEAQESHNQVMDSLLREAEELREQLSHERDLRVKNQQLREHTLIEIDQFNSNTITEQTNANRYLAKGKEKYEHLTERETDCDQILTHNQKEKERLTIELDTANINFSNMKEKLEDIVNKLEKDITFYSGENRILTNEIDQFTPSYTVLCKDFADRTNEYNETRQTLIKAKSKKAMVETAIAKCKQQIEDHDNAREKK